MKLIPAESEALTAKTIDIASFLSSPKSHQAVSFPPRWTPDFHPSLLRHRYRHHRLPPSRPSHLQYLPQRSIVQSHLPLLLMHEEKERKNWRLYDDLQVLNWRWAYADCRRVAVGSYWRRSLHPNVFISADWNSGWPW